METFSLEETISALANSGFAMELATSALLVAFGFLARSIYGFYTTIKMQRKHHVSGRYIMSYSRPSDEDWRKVHLQCRLNLRGTKVLGVGNFYDEEWILKAEIDSGGNLIGSYRPNIRFTKATGTFCMKPINGNDWEGWWAGMSRETEELVGGELQLLRVPKVKFCSPKSGNHNSSVDILREQIPKNIQELIAKEWDSLDIICALDNGAVIGFVSFCLSASVEATLTWGDAPPSIQRAAGQNALGIVTEIAVERSFRERGVGSMLLARAIKELSSRGATTLMSLEATESRSSLLPSHGFKPETINPEQHACWPASLIIFYRPAGPTKRKSLPRPKK